MNLFSSQYSAPVLASASLIMTLSPCPSSGTAITATSPHLSHQQKTEKLTKAIKEIMKDVNFPQKNHAKPIQLP